MTKQRKQEARRIVYYRDELNDEHSGIKRNTIRIGADFPYIHKSRLWNACAAVVYRGIMTPIAFLWCKLKFGLRIIGREKMKQTAGQGCFLYGNHTLMAGDAFIPNLVSFPKRNYVVVNADNLSVKGAKNWTQMSGALPIPTELSCMRAFLSAMEMRVKSGYAITVYPEAHIWPYYTGIRRFGAAAFRYPVRFSAPVYCTTVTYSKKRFGKIPRVTVYVDGPFYADETLHPRQREAQLRDTVYETMCRRAQNSSYSPIEYRRAEEEQA